MRKIILTIPLGDTVNRSFTDSGNRKNFFKDL